jgi:hypothetical protein
MARTTGRRDAMNPSRLTPGWGFSFGLMRPRQTAGNATSAKGFAAAGQHHRVSGNFREIGVRDSGFSLKIGWLEQRF